MTRVTEELSFKFYLILISLNLRSYMWLVATILDNTILEKSSGEQIEGDLEVWVTVGGEP